TTINHSSNNDSEYESEMDANEKSNDPDLMKYNDSTLSNKKKRLSALKTLNPVVLPRSVFVWIIQLTQLTLMNNNSTLSK
ncbi:unnamed protein product, partial [Rotaria magnacalcarata]